MRLLPLTFALITALSPALAAVEWTGPGWYVNEVDEDANTSKLISGPFADEGSCKAQIPDHDWEDYETTGIFHFCSRWPTRPN